MADPKPPDNTVRILEPDTRLKKKLGSDVSFDQVVSPQVIASAQVVIEDSSADLLAATLQELGHLENAAARLTLEKTPDDLLHPLIEAAFAIKSKAGLCGYSFASSLAKSLCVFCERDGVRHQPLTATTLQIIRTQMEGLKTIFTNKITGDGGKVGEAILAELQKLLQDY